MQLIANFGNRLRGEFILSSFTMMDIDNLIRNNLRRLIEQRNVQQNKLAAAIGVTASVINDILAGRKPVGKDTMTRLCKAFDIEPWEFYWTEKTPIIKDDQELKDIQQRREADRVGIADMVREAEASWIEAAKKKKLVVSDSLDLRLQRLRERAVKNKHEEKLEAQIESMPELAKKLRPKKRKNEVA